MKTAFSFISIFLICFACKEQGYINKYKWKVPGYHKTEDYVKSKPVYIKQTLQFTSENDVNSKTGVQNSYDEYRFNSVGDIIHQRKFITDDFFSDTDFSYDQNGLGYVLIFTLRNNGITKFDTVVSKSVLQANGKFRRITINEDGPKVVVESFLNEGRLVVEEHLKNETDVSDVLLTIKKHYENDRLVKTELMQQDGSLSTEQYHYSAKGLLDSVVRVIKTTSYNRIEKRVFQHNEQGDYILYAEISGNGDTTELAKAKYLYDKKGNWVRKLINEETRSDGKPMVTIVGTKKYMLLIREIKYSE